MYKLLLSILFIFSCTLSSMDPYHAEANIEELLLRAALLHNDLPQFQRFLGSGVIPPHEIIQLAINKEGAMRMLYDATQKSAASAYPEETKRTIEKCYQAQIEGTSDDPNNILLDALAVDNFVSFTRLLDGLIVIPTLRTVHLASINNKAIMILHECAQGASQSVIYPKEVIALIKKYYQESVHVTDNVVDSLTKNANNGKENNPAAPLPETNHTLADQPNWQNKIISTKSAFIGLTVIALSGLTYRYVSKWLKKRTENKNHSEEKQQGLVNA